MRISKWGEIDAPPFQSHSEAKGWHTPKFTKMVDKGQVTPQERAKWNKLVPKLPRRDMEIPVGSAEDVEKYVREHHRDVYFEGTRNEHS